MDGSRFFSRKGGLEDPRDIFVVFWGEGGGVPRSLFSIILLCDFNKFEFSRGGTPSAHASSSSYNNDTFTTGEDSPVSSFDNTTARKESESAGITRRSLDKLPVSGDTQQGYGSGAGGVGSTLAADNILIILLTINIYILVSSVLKLY